MSITAVKHIEDYKLQISFSDGAAGIIDFKPLLEKHEIYRPYLKPERFAKFKFEWCRLYWPGNRLDFHYSHLKNLLMIS